MASGEILAILAAAIAAGAINAVVGSGSLITFPTLLAFGFPPVLANVSNNVGLVPGNVSGALGYREELAGQRGRLIRLGAASCAGALAGACALLALPAGVFEVVVPALIIIACVLVVVQPRLSAWVASRGKSPAQHGGPLLLGSVFLAGVYGGYFGAAQGVLVIGLLGVFLTEGLQRINAGKNVLVTVVNATAAIVFVSFAHVAWVVVALIAAGSTAGALIGARVGRRLPPLALRIIIVVIGVIAAVKLVFF
ncbi:MAG TPA: sulfite exporter TauE/SafE family protein [Streptosporangiaceae bacterium]|nr:sulfite exporter TauE/SafE family protein [Streptosporangiaceae bacterium]